MDSVSPGCSPAAVSLLPDQSPPSLRSAPSGINESQFNLLDAACIAFPPAAGGKLAGGLGYAGPVGALLDRARLEPGKLATLTLPNRRQTLVVAGALAPGADAFTRLSLAGRMLRETRSRAPRSLALDAIGLGAAAPPMVEALGAAALAQAFRLPDYRAPSRPETPLASVRLHCDELLALPRLLAEARAGNLTRWLTSLPPNLLDARAYRRALTRLAREAGATLRWYGEKELLRAGAGAFLAVAAGNASRDAGIAHLSWRPRARRSSRRPDLALVGKGILFDTGGNNLKSHRSMLDMHTDMAGSATALAAFLALVELRAPLAVDCWLAITENRIGPTAYRPQDVVRAANGVTIQVIHTDAEGRMALADTLALAARTQPALIVDFATLTGACVTALTERISGAFTNRDELRPLLERAGRISGERVWSFPMEPDFDADLESPCADIMQCTVDSKGDHILAARFLNRFVPSTLPWVHVDLTSATRTGGLGHVATDVTGFGSRFFLEFLLGQQALRQVTLR